MSECQFLGRRKLIGTIWSLAYLARKAVINSLPHSTCHLIVPSQRSSTGGRPEAFLQRSWGGRGRCVSLGNPGGQFAGPSSGGDHKGVLVGVSRGHLREVLGEGSGERDLPGVLGGFFGSVVGSHPRGGGYTRRCPRSREGIRSLTRAAGSASVPCSRGGECGPHTRPRAVLLSTRTSSVWKGPPFRVCG